MGQLPFLLTKNKRVNLVQEYVIVGYSVTCKAYRLCEKVTRQFIVSRDVYFIERSFEKDYIDFDIPSLLERSPDVEEEETKPESKDDISATSEVEDDHENIVTRPERGPGRPKIVRTGHPGRPGKEYNALSLAVDKNRMKVPETVEEAIHSD